MRLRTWILLVLVAAAILMALNYLFWIGAIPYEYVYSTTMLLTTFVILISFIEWLIEKIRKRRKAEAVSGTM